jgi:hypothetical protein
MSSSDSVRSSSPPTTPDAPGHDTLASARAGAVSVGSATTVPGAGTPLAHVPPLRSQRSLRARDLPLVTSLGKIAVARRNRLELLAVDGREVDAIGAPSLQPLHVADFTERVVLTGVATCASSAADCKGSAPFWLVLRHGATPRLIRSSAVATRGTAPDVTALASGVHVDLGIWNGMHRWALLTARDDPFIVTLPESRTRLDRAECAQVLRALESCAAVRGCGSYARIAAALPAQRAADVRQLFHTTTGLNAAQFRNLCARSCQLGLTPTRAFVQQRVCSGAEAGQWDADLP